MQKLVMIVPLLLVIMLFAFVAENPSGTKIHCEYYPIDLPNPVPQNTYQPIYGFALNDIYAGSSTIAPGHVYHFNTAWTVSQSYSDSSVEGIWGLNANDIWVGGLATAINQPLHHWDGNVWTHYSTPTVTAGTTRGFWGAASNDIYATTTFSTNAGGIRSSYVLHWDGNSWTRQTVEAVPSAQSVTTFISIFGFAADDIYMGGSSVSNTVPEIWHWDGISWSRMTLPAGNFRVQNIWGSSTTNIYAALATNGADVGRVIHWDGISWETVLEDSQNQFTGIFGLNENSIYVAASKRIWHYDGSEWEMVLDTGNGLNYKGHGVNMQRVWAYDEFHVYLTSTNRDSDNGYVMTKICNLVKSDFISDASIRIGILLFLAIVPIALIMGRDE